MPAHDLGDPSSPLQPLHDYNPSGGSNPSEAASREPLNVTEIRPFAQVYRGDQDGMSKLP